MGFWHVYMGIYGGSPAVTVAPAVATIRYMLDGTSAEIMRLDGQSRQLGKLDGT